VFPAGYVLDLVYDENAALAEQFDQQPIQIVGIFGLEAEEALVLEVDVVEALLA
jgi:hypothetical protein